MDYIGFGSLGYLCQAYFSPLFWQTIAVASRSGAGKSTDRGSLPDLSRKAKQRHESCEKQGGIGCLGGFA